VSSSPPFSAGFLLSYLFPPPLPCRLVRPPTAQIHGHLVAIFTAESGLLLFARVMSPFFSSALRFLPLSSFFAFRLEICPFTEDSLCVGVFSCRRP